MTGLLSTTGLLVSVRNVEEAAAALNGGADVIDVKEPDHGALGAASIETIQAIQQFVGDRAPVSAACGELADSDSFPFSKLPPLAFAKIGLSNCNTSQDWSTRFTAAWQKLPEKIGRVSVAYGDWKKCGAPPPEEVVRVGKQNECSHFLLDTVCKTQCLFDFVSESQLDNWSALANAHNMRLVVAGSIRKDQFELIVRRWQPEFVAVRGAACVSDRNSRVTESRVSELKSQLVEIERAHQRISR